MCSGQSVVGVQWESAEAWRKTTYRVFTQGGIVENYILKPVLHRLISNQVLQTLLKKTKTKYNLSDILKDWKISQHSAMVSLAQNKLILSLLETVNLFIVAVLKQSNQTALMVKICPYMDFYLFTFNYPNLWTACCQFARHLTSRWQVSKPCNLSFLLISLQTNGPCHPEKKLWQNRWFSMFYVSICIIT